MHGGRKFVIGFRNFAIGEMKPSIKQEITETR